MVFSFYLGVDYSLGTILSRWKGQAARLYFTRLWVNLAIIAVKGPTLHRIL